MEGAEVDVTEISEPCDPTQDDPTVASACVITVVSGDGTGTNDKILTRHTNETHPEISLNLNADPQIKFDPVRGIVEIPSNTPANEDFTVTLTSALNKELSVKVNRLGKVSICSPDGQIPSYRDC